MKRYWNLLLYWTLLFAVRKASTGVSIGFVFDLQPFAAYCETRNTQTKTSVTTTTTNSNLSLMCYVPEESALSFYLKMEAVGSSEMLVTIYENQQSLIVTAAFTHASLCAHSHVKCVLKWSKTHIMHYTYTATTTTSHTQIKDANNCIKNFTHISFPFLTFKMGQT